MVAFGSWDIGEKMNEWLRNFFNDMATDITNKCITWAGDVITNPINFTEQIPNFDSLLLGFQAIGGLTLLIHLYQKVMSEMFNEAVGVDEVNWAKIIGSTLISAGMIYSFPVLVDQIGVVVAELTNWVSVYKVEFKAADQIFQSFAPGPDEIITSSFFMILLCLVWSIALLGLTIAGGVYAALKGLCILISPLIMAAIVVNPSLAKQFCMKLLSYMLMQPYQMLCLYLAMAIASIGGIWGMLGSLSFLCFGVFPPIMKTLVSSVGVGSTTGNAAKMIMIKMLRR